MDRIHVFLSYCHEDAAEVELLHDALTAAGETVWWDRDIKGGQDWKQEIRTALNSAYAIVICLSARTSTRKTSGIYPEAFDSIALYREYAPGSIFLIPVRLTDCGVPAIAIDANRTLDTDFSRSNLGEPVSGTGNRPDERARPEW
jgi:TIR domain